MSLNPENPIPDPKNDILFNIIKGVIFELSNKENNKNILLGITGAGGAGKTTLAGNIIKFYSKDIALAIDLDDYLISREQRGKLGLTRYDIEANKLQYARQNIIDLSYNKNIKKPRYNHSTGEVLSEEEVQPKKLIVLEGVTSLYPPLRDLYNFSVFMDAFEETQIKSRIERDVNKRMYTLEEALLLFEKLKPLYKKLVEPTRKYASLEGTVDINYVFTPTKIAKKWGKLWDV